MSDLRDKFFSTKIPIVEIFQSISGEGISAGNIVTFVRVAGCDLRCTWCDTKYSFEENAKSVDQLLPEDVVKKLCEFGTNEVICTGGEPLEHNKAKRYLPAFLQSKGFNVRIETSGASKLYDNTELSFFNLSNRTRPVYTMDIKCPASGMSDRNMFKNIDTLDERDELKFVVADDQDLDYSIEIIDQLNSSLSERQITLNFSPVFNALDPEFLVEFLKRKSAYFQENDLKARLSLQIHKFIWPPHQRGV